MARDEILPGIWGETAETTIPAQPQTSTTYRNTAFNQATINSAWPFNRIVNSADTNQFLYLLSKITKQGEENGIIEWSTLIDYPDKAWSRGSDGIVYESLQTPNVNQDPTSSPLYWGALGTGNIETDTRTLLIETGFTYAQIQEVFDSIGSIIPNGINIIVEWQNGTYNIGANVLIMPEYVGGGQIISRAINITGAQTSTKLVTVVGTGGPQGNQTGLEPWSPAQAYTLVSISGNQGLVIAEIAFEMSGNFAGQDISVIRVVRGFCSLQSCSLKNLSPAGATARSIEVYTAGFAANAHANNCYFEAPLGTLTGSRGVFASNTGQFAVNASVGSADFAYEVHQSDGHANNDGMSFGIALTNEIVGEIYIA